MIAGTVIVERCKLQSWAYYDYLFELVFRVATSTPLAGRGDDHIRQVYQIVYQVIKW